MYYSEIINAAEKTVNELKLLDEHKIEVDILDDGCTPKQGIITVVQALNSTQS